MVYLIGVVVVVCMGVYGWCVQMRRTLCAALCLRQALPSSWSR
jgi:hypothetical protein